MKMGGTAKSENAKALMIACVALHLPHRFHLGEPDEEMAAEGADVVARAPMNPVNMLGDLLLAVAAIGRACGISKNDLRRILAGAYDGVSQEVGQQLMQEALLGAMETSSGDVTMSAAETVLESLGEDVDDSERTKH